MNSFLSDSHSGRGEKSRLAAMMLLATASIGALSIGATAASAQDTAASAQDATAAGIGDIVVTANRREQRLQDVPIAISAITADTAKAQGITGTATLQAAVPSLVVVRQANQAQPYLRGLGSVSGAPNAEPSVAIYVDGVYMPSANANFFDFNNIDRIEVLKGPQGTLFGRNASGGVIQIITKDPHDKPEAQFEVGYANYKTVTGQAYLAAPIAEGLGASVAVLYKNQGEGWGTNIFTGEDTPGVDNFGVRGKLVYAGDDTTIKLAGDYSHNRDAGINGQNPPGTRNVNLPLIFATGLGEPFPGEYNTNNNFEQKSNIETGGVSLTVDHDFGPLQFKSISAYRKTTGFWTYDQDLSGWQGLDAVINQKSRMYTQEVHLISPAGNKFQWLVGAFYYNYKAGNSPQELNGELLDIALFRAGDPSCIISNTCNGNAGVDLQNFTKSTSYAVFAQGTYPIFENTNLTIGARYTWDKVRYDGTTFLHGTNIIISGPTTEQFKNDDPTFRVSIDHKFTPNIMAYASWNRGMKAGGFDLSAFDNSLNASLPFDPEKVNAYELGVKTDLFDRKVRLNLGGFYYDFKNMQFQKIFQGNGITFNSPNGAVMYGVELDLLARVTDNLTLNASAAWLHTRLRDFPGAPNTCLSSVTGLNDNGGFFCNGPDGLPDPNNLIPFNAKGNNTPNSPELTYTIGAVYTIPTSFGSLDVAGNVYYSAKSYFEIDNRVHNDSYYLVNASILWTHPDERFTVRLWGKNLTNHYYYSQYTGQGGASDVAGPAAPREYGMTIGYKF